MDIQVTLTAKTCGCGMVYAVPHWMQYLTYCPACGHRSKEEVRHERDVALRAISALKGQITSCGGSGRVWEIVRDV